MFAPWCGRTGEGLLGSGPVLASTLLAGLLLSATPPQDDSVTVLTVSDRTPLAFVLNTPTGEQGRLRVSAILSAVAEAFDAQTDLQMAAVDVPAVAECEGSLACLARRAPKGADLLLVLSYFAATGDRPDRVSALLVDVGAAHACATDPFAGENVDTCVSERAVRERPEPKIISQAGEAQSALRQLVQQDLRISLEATGHWEPHGQVLLQGVPQGAAVLLDERTVGVAPGGTVRLKGVSPGAHVVSYAAVGTLVEGQPVLVQRREVAQVVFLGKAVGSTRPLFWSGVALSAVGAGLSIWSLAYVGAQGDLSRNCDDGRCGSRFFTIEQQARGSLEALQVNPNRGSVLALPLGYSLLTTGAVWAGGAELFESDTLTQVVVVGAGLVAGGLLYGVSAAANPP